ncbi:adenosine deaminase [Nicoletella semolina]|uniref:adenosine deaminase n=1 Tax=Nicoletella semolina TaxID=271160 RepID=A0A4R2N9Z7_9PAST|nr:adenosine deaminase [Nicoletella semolina]MDH2925411.1 adenosine deaminase [Nicoletella semolina]TCP17891.1 adenosine deaminase [Nicoletella semolina]
MNNQLKQYGIIELHLHLDGSLSPEWIIEWAEKQQIALPTKDIQQLNQYISVPADCTDLNDYLRCFALPVSLLQTPAALTSAVCDLVERLDKLGLVYAEIRFAPQLHTRKSMTQEQAVQAALQGLKQGLANKTNLFTANLILCCMRFEDNQAQNMETIHLTKQYLGQGVVAADLAGSENLHPMEYYAAPFEFAKQSRLPFTLHAGEGAGAENVAKALDLGAARIGHGVRAIENHHVVERLASQKTPLEMCPCSNLQTKTVKHLADYPLRTFLQKGIVATLSSDNMTVSNTTIHAQFELLENHYQLSQTEAQQLVRNAIQAAFLSEQDKQALLAYTQQRYPELAL